MKAPTFAVALLSLCILTYAQDLRPNEFIALGQRKIADIDSAMAAKGFEKKDISPNDAGFSIITYTYMTGSGSSLVQRSLHLGWRPTIHVLELEYGIWQKEEAFGFVQELLREGFKRSVRSMPNMDGSKIEFVEYKRGADDVTYKEMDQGSGVWLYIFSIDNEHYKP